MKKILILRKAALALMMVMLSGWAAAAAGLGTVTYVIVGVTVGMVVAFLLRKDLPVHEEDPYAGLAAAYGSMLSTACVLVFLQAAQYYRESRISPVFGYLIAAMLIPQVVFPAILRGDRE
ncbi:MAG TPA: hypothetical protein DCZ93_10050 [Elusimicrobia bacterium]|nr:MAG: hypothetical protein A2X35_00685 [Elusimicrobia bacterium GWA2_61_42]HBB67618.1 hypothetical protein [Elusimicrobiota bacterium]